MCISKYIVFDNKESIVLNKFIVWYCKFLCMHVTALHQFFEVLCVTTNHFKFYEIALCDILKTLASVFV